MRTPSFVREEEDDDEVKEAAAHQVATYERQQDQTVAPRRSAVT